jgi:Protein of unknown function (DUF1499)
MSRLALTLAVLLAALIGLQLYIRFSPVDAARQNASPSLYALDHDGPWDQIVTMPNGASLRLSLTKGTPADLLARLDAVALATPRTRRLAGTPGDGRITWETRSLLWGFPDYTTAEVRPDGLYIHARQRFGRGDLGVNAARLKDWLSRL